MPANVIDAKGRIAAAQYNVKATGHLAPASARLVDLGRSLDTKPNTGVIRSTFVVDENGKISLAQYNVKATGHVDKLRRDLSV